MINVVVFNWNYSDFLTKLLKKMEPIYNDAYFRILICDDGSTDDSLKIIHEYVSKGINNIVVFERSELNYGRKMPYMGQIESLGKVMASDYFSSSDYYWLMDADDYFDFSIISAEFKRKIESSVVNFTQVKNVSENDIYYENIKRKVCFNSSIFPTISVTSSIIVSGFFLEKYKTFIFKDGFDDVWLDSRINMLACLLKSNEVAYIDEHVCRLIHGGNDSINMPVLRALKKQIVAHNYYKFINGNKFLRHHRMIILWCASKLIRLFKC
ncbi:glycosyltransferase family 2 protein [Aeromonas caviae]|uniref:glycosyltransferase family 2 protein n=1 Tax=Aeromonas caviae TaxID=648 RepID=UPI000DE5AA1B|nr:glycosyltransferase family 2 protein [Aeromonas caviae]MDX7751824.1 glycosyltransferase family 2 protein [Aeromonas caviae]MDX7869066.1 glycosyltransferase family 2 protein [Aeromonas caviae]